MNRILSLRITLDETNPPIWRTVLVPDNVSFFDLHHILQITMGWTNSHLFEFQIGDYKVDYIGPETIDGDEDLADAKLVSLDLLLNKTGQTFIYQYDFGDDWMHTVVIEDVVAADRDKKYPLCTDGEMACPREDSGGIYGHYRNMEIIKDKKHPEYSDTKTWLGRGYDPLKFSKENVNKELPRFKSYMKHWR